MKIFKNITIVLIFCFLRVYSQIDTTNVGKDNAKLIKKNIDTVNNTKIKTEVKTSPPLKPVLKRHKVKLLITRAGAASSNDDVRNSWFSALTEAYFYFQLHNYESFDVIQRKEYSKSLKQSDGFGVIIPKNSIYQAAKSMKASHVLSHTYNYNKKDSEWIKYSIEIVNPKNKKIIMSYTTSFHPDSIDNELRRCTEKILEKLHITLNDREKEILKRPVFSLNSAINKNFGIAMVDINDDVTIKTAPIILKFARNDPEFGLAAFKAAQMYETLNDYTQASNLYSQVILRNGFYSNRLFIDAASNDRKREAYDKALRTLSIAEKKGIKTVDIYLEKAINYEKSRNPENVQECYEEILKLDPNQPDAILFMAKVKRKDGLYQESLELLSLIKPASSIIALLNLEKGENYLALGKNKEAFTALQSAYKLLPDNLRIIILLGEINFKLEKYQIASTHFKTAFEKQPNDLGLLLKTSHAYKMAKQFKKALDILKKYKSTFYDSKQVDKEIGLLRFYMSDTTGARSILETCINLNPPDSSVFMVLGDIYASAGEQEQAIAMYERAEPLVKDTFSIKLALANLYLIKKEYKNAENRFRSIISVNPQLPKVNRYLADILSIKDQKAESLEFYKKEIKYHGNNIYVQQKIAKLYFELNDLTNAQKEAEKLIKLDQSNAFGYFQLSIIAVKQKRTSDAKLYFEKGESTGKSTLDNYLTLGEGFASIGAYGKAIDAYNKCLKSDSANEKVLIELSKIYSKTKQDSLAVQTYKAIYNKNPSKNSIYLEKAGHIYFKLENKSSARQVYSTLLNKGYVNNQIILNAATIEFQSQAYEKTISLLKMIKENKDSGEKVIKMFAISYYETKKYSLAQPYFSFFLENSLLEKSFIEMAAQTFEKTDKFSSALAMYKKYLTFKKDKNHKDFAYRVAQIYEKQKSIPLAITRYKKNILLFPSDFRNYENLCDLLLKDKKYKSVQSILIKATKRPDCPPELFKKLATIYDLQKMSTQASVMYEKYLKIVPQDYEVWNTLGSLYFSQHKYKLAIAPLETSTKHIPNELSNYYNLGYSFCQTKQFGKAINPLQKVLALESDNLKVLSLLSQCYTIEKDTTNLITILKKRIVFRPNDYKLHLEIGGLLLSTKQYKAATQAFETANKIKPGDVNVLLNLVELYERVNDTTKWILTLDKVLNNFPNNFQIHYKKALYHIAHNELKKAKASLKKSLSLQPIHAHANYNYAKLLEKEKQYKAAFFHFDRAFKTEPDNIEYVLKLAEISTILGKHSFALKSLNKALKLEPDNSKILQLLGSVYYNKKQYSKAEPLFLRCLEIDKNCHTCYEQLGIISYKKKDYQKTSKYLSHSVQNNDKNYTVFLLYANSLLFQNQLRKAHAFYQKAFEINPKSDEAYYRLIASSINVGLEDKAIIIYDLNKNRGNSGWNYLAKGRILELSGENTKAYRLYSSALNSYPNNSEVHKGLGRINLSMKKYNNALQNFSMAMVDIPDDFESYTGMGKAFYYLENYQASLDLFKETLPKQPENIEIYTMIGLNYSKLKKYKSAIDILRQGLKIESRNADIHFALGTTYTRNLQFKKAILSFRNSARFDEEIAIKAYRNIGDIYYHKLKSNKNAKKYYTKYIEAGGTDSKVRSLMSSL